MTLPMERVGDRILSIRGHRVMLDADLAELYGVQTKALNQAIKRNEERFPEDFAFRLTSEEKKELVTICDRLAAGGDGTEVRPAIQGRVRRHPCPDGTAGESTSSDRIFS